MVSELRAANGMADLTNEQFELFWEAVDVDESSMLEFEEFKARASQRASSR